MSTDVGVDNIDPCNVDWINVVGILVLSATEAAARLGVKKATLYAYVSRGTLARTVGPDGRTSLFDPAEIERLRAGRGRPDDGTVQALIATGLTRVDDDALLVRGHDLVRLVADGASFVDAVELLWDGEADAVWPLREHHDASAHAAAAAGSRLDALRIICALASATDPLRHDLAPKGVRATGRRLIADMAVGLPPFADGRDNAVPAALWRRLTAMSPDPGRVRALDAAMALLVDHGLAASTFAARVAASVRADPYSVVSAGLGVIGGPLHGAASAGVHELLVAAEELGDAPRAVGERRRRSGHFPGFGHTVYTEQDPRYGALMARVVAAWGDDPRLVNVYRVRDVITERLDAVPNVDLAIGALTYLAAMPAEAGEIIFAIARTAGWLAHAMEEYEERPVRFRPRARYSGPRPEDLVPRGGPSR